MRHVNRFVAAAMVAVVALIVAVGAYAFASGGGGGSSAQPTPTNTPSPTPTATTPAPSPTPAPPTATPTPPPPTTRPDQPVSSTPSSATPTPPTPTAPPGVTTAPQLEIRPAPIDGLEMRVLESYPPQYVVGIKAGLPSGCAKPYSHDVTRSGNTITITVLNSMPAGAICTAIYGTYELNLNLGSDFTAGQTYVVKVNDKQTSFVAE